jgi:dTDP-4-amino-4,6-dideoxygalactose transaminase
MKELIPVTKSDLPPIDDYIAYLKQIWRSGILTNYGDLTKQFEEKLADYLGVKYVVTVGNATLGLQLALRALDVKTGSEIITTPFTFAATTNIIVYEGFKPVFADIDQDTYCINPDDIERKITLNTSVILPVHVYGNPCDVERINKIADENHLKVVYDAAHAFGVTYKGNSLASYGDVSVLSFHATKLFQTIEGGAVITNQKDIAEKIKLLRNHGIKSEDEVLIPGINAKLNEFEAAMGLCNLMTIEGRIKEREKLYVRYKSNLSNEAVKFQELRSDRYNYIYMPVVFQSKEIRDSIYKSLGLENIKCRKYFYPLTASYVYFKEDMIEKYGLLNAKDISNRVLCLPLYTSLGVDNVDKISDMIKIIMKN